MTHVTFVVAYLLLKWPKTYPTTELLELVYINKIFISKQATL
jgi:hypothetical protein